MFYCGLVFCGRFLIGLLEAAVEIGGGPDTSKESVKTSPPLISSHQPAAAVLVNKRSARSHDGSIEQALEVFMLLEKKEIIFQEKLYMLS